MMMWSLRVLLMWSIMAASVVDLPLPVGPVTRIDRKGKCRGDAGGLPDRIFWHAVQRGAAAGGTVVLKAGGVPDDTGGFR